MIHCKSWIIGINNEVTGNQFPQDWWHTTLMEDSTLNVTSNVDTYRFLYEIQEFPQAISRISKKDLKFVIIKQTLLDRKKRLRISGDCYHLWLNSYWLTVIIDIKKKWQQDGFLPHSSTIIACRSEGVSDCCLTPMQQYFSYIMARTS